jgi:hypothetical protein
MTRAHTEGRQRLTVRRVVTKLTPALYVRLYAVKLRTGRSLQSLVEEGIQLIVAKNRVDRDTNEPVEVTDAR